MKFKSLKKFTIRIIIFNFLIINFLQIEPLLSNQKSTKPTQDYLRKGQFLDDYILGPGDILSISVANDLRELDMKVTIDGDGFAILKRIKRVYLEGLTIKELTELLNKEYLKYIYNPQVEISVLNYRPIEINLKGEVLRPGKHILPGSINPLLLSDTDFTRQLNSPKIDENKVYFPTIVDALKKGGGLKTNSDLSEISLIRINNLTNGGGLIKAKISLLDYKKNELKNENNIRIYDGDTIIIKKSDMPILGQISLAVRSNINPKMIKIYVGGEVKKSGELEIYNGATLNEVLLLSGLKKVIKGKVSFVRYKSDGSLDKREFRSVKNQKPGSYSNPFLENGDIVYVGKSNFSLASEILTEITSPFKSVVETFVLYKIIRDD